MITVNYCKLLYTLLLSKYFTVYFQYLTVYYILYYIIYYFVKLIRSPYNFVCFTAFHWYGISQIVLVHWMANMSEYRHQEILDLHFITISISIQLYSWLCAMLITSLSMLILGKQADGVTLGCLKIHNLDQPY